MYHVLFISTTTYYYLSKYLISYPFVVYHIVCCYHFIHSTAAFLYKSKMHLSQIDYIYLTYNSR